MREKNIWTNMDRRRIYSDRSDCFWAVDFVGWHTGSPTGIDADITCCR